MQETENCPSEEELIEFGSAINRGRDRDRDRDRDGCEASTFEPDPMCLGAFDF